MLTPYYEQDGITIYHADCRDVLPTLEGGSVDLVLTDPPYGIGKAEWDAAVPTWAIPLLAASLRDGGSLYWFGVPPMIYEVYAATPLRFMRELHWWCDTGYPCPNNYRLATESILFFVKGDEPSYFDDTGIREEYQVARPGGGRIHNPRGKSPGNVIYMPRPAPGHASENEHVSAKPLALMRRLIGTSCALDGLVLDPFLGSGTTARACMDMGRRCIGIEQDERWCEIAARRLMQSVLPLAL